MPAAILGRISTQVRLDETTYQKMKIIAKSEKRSTNAQLEYFMKIGVEAYEAEHGEIVLGNQNVL